MPPRPPVRGNTQLLADIGQGPVYEAAPALRAQLRWRGHGSTHRYHARERDGRWAIIDRKGDRVVAHAPTESAARIMAADFSNRVAVPPPTTEPTDDIIL